MTKYLKLFETTSDYEAYINGEGVVLPNVSVAKDAPKTVYFNPIPPFFVKLSLNNGEVVELQGSGELTSEMVTPYETTIVSAEIGELCTSIGRFAFSGCSSLTSITIPDSVTIIDGFAFGWCSGLTNVTIGNGVTSIGERVFEGCTVLTSIVVDSANTVYDSRDNCNAIINTSTNELILGCKNTVIPNTVTSIGEQSFYQCTGLTSVTIPNSVTSIGRDAFYQCTGLTSVTIPNSVINIGDTAFHYCTSLTNVTIGSGLTSIGNAAFNNCTGLTSITIPNGVTSIGERAFTGCSGLTSIVVDSANTVYDSRDNCNAIIKTSANELILGCKNTVIPNTVTSIGNFAFSSCTGLTSITIPDSVTSIGNAAFFECTSLTSITIPNSVTSIGERAFSSCTGLTSITSLATTAPTIDSWTFYDVKIGGTLTVPSGSTGYNVWMGTGNYYLGKYEWIIPFFAKLSLNNGEVVELQGSGELTQAMITPYKSSVVGAEFGKLCTSIGSSAFYDCNGLTSVTIPDGVISISNNAFGNCTGLTSITCNATTAPTIDSSTFQNIKTGGTLTVPSGSTGYDTWMGTGNYYLGKYGWTKVEPFFAKLSLDNGEVVELQGSGALTYEMVSQYKPSLVSAEIGESCTSIGDLAFSRCSALTSITIGNGVTSISSSAFSSCRGLTSVTIGSGVTSISDSAFNECTNLTSITSLATTAPTIDSWTFYDIKTGGTLTVPRGSTGYDEWMDYLDMYNWTKVEQ